MLGSPILYLKGMGISMFQLSGFYCITPKICHFSQNFTSDIRQWLQRLQPAASLAWLQTQAASLHFPQGSMYPNSIYFGLKVVPM